MLLFQPWRAFAGEERLPLWLGLHLVFMCGFGPDVRRVDWCGGPMHWRLPLELIPHRPPGLFFPCRLNPSRSSSVASLYTAGLGMPEAKTWDSGTLGLAPGNVESL